ncbi:MAG TPA: flagellar basal-body rod protein FlgG [Alphaproteobacteria bacterium]|nr:flagellar basal-body rod protein FlgG [Alphaproteobacteria bacterium]
MKALSIAATGMLAQQLNVEVISNNIANMTTTSFKRQRPEFQDLLYQNMRRIGAASSDAGTIAPSGIQIGTGVRAASIYRITTQGNAVSTGNALDLSIQGKGYFQVELPNGNLAYTRAGTFQLSPDGEIVTAEGYIVSPGVVVPADATDITINESGEVLVKLDGQVDPQNVGQLELVNFPNEAGLEAIGDNLYLESASSGTPGTGTPGTDGFGRLLQGFLETSNVDAVAEITALITAQRAYELNSKVVTAVDEMMNATTQMR